MLGIRHRHDLLFQNPLQEAGANQVLVVLMRLEPLAFVQNIITGKQIALLRHVTPPVGDLVHAVNLF